MEVEVVRYGTNLWVWVGIVVGHRIESIEGSWRSVAEAKQAAGIFAKAQGWAIRWRKTNLNHKRD